MDTCESMTNWVSRPDMTITVDWTLKAIFHSIPTHAETTAVTTH